MDMTSSDLHLCEIQSIQESPPSQRNNIHRETSLSQTKSATEEPPPPSLRRNHSVVPLPPPPKTRDVIKKKCKKCCGKVYKVVSSTAGLVVILVLYSFMGAAILFAIEGRHETVKKTDIKEVQARAARAAWNLTQHYGQKHEEFLEHIAKELLQYELALRKLISETRSSSNQNDWDFWGSLLFCTTVYSTIGYGHVAPSTDFGRIFTMVYALFGIPLWLIAMADLGKKLTIMLKFLWSFVRRFYYTGRCKKVRRSIPVKTIKDGLGVLYSKRATLDTDNWELHDTDTISELSEEPPKHFEVDDQFNLPPIVAILLIIVYLLVGAVIYTRWETSWSYLDAFYFIFISVSTIGFGDVIPEYKTYFLAAFVYIIIGISFVAMVITVIMDVVNSTLDKAKNKVIDYGHKHGIDLEDDDTVRTDSTIGRESPDLNQNKRDPEFAQIEIVPDDELTVTMTDGRIIFKHSNQDKANSENPWMTDPDLKDYVIIHCVTENGILGKPVTAREPQKTSLENIEMNQDVAEVMVYHPGSDDLSTCSVHHCPDSPAMSTSSIVDEVEVGEISPDKIISEIYPQERIIFVYKL